MVVTVAGQSSRFSSSIGKKCLKCIYSNDGIEQSLLYEILMMGKECDKTVVVGGFMYDQLEQSLSKYPEDIREKIYLIENKEYRTFGSGYSLYLGLKKALELCPDEIIFVEGDLSVSPDDFKKVIDAHKDALTYNCEPIDSHKSVAFFYNLEGKVRYIYSVEHEALSVDEPFESIYNSAQIWKFTDIKEIKNIVDESDCRDWYGTNLIFINRYFQSKSKDDVVLINFKKWVNCNTIEDYLRSRRDTL